MIKLESLPYSRTALEPVISSLTIDFHYGKHHAGYVKKTNGLLKDSPLKDLPLVQIVKSSSGDLLNNAAQVLNHDLYWRSLCPAQQTLPDLLKFLIELRYKSLNKFKDEYLDKGMSLLGSGWLWITKDGMGIGIEATPNADTPLRTGSTPLLTVDLWEHAYYLDYQNDRQRYLREIFKRLDWNAARERFLRTLISRKLISRMKYESA